MLGRSSGSAQTEGSMTDFVTVRAWDEGRIGPEDGAADAATEYNDQQCVGGVLFPV